MAFSLWKQSNELDLTLRGIQKGEYVFLISSEIKTSRVFFDVIALTTLVTLRKHWVYSFFVGEWNKAS